MSETKDDQFDFDFFSLSHSPRLFVQSTICQSSRWHRRCSRSSSPSSSSFNCSFFRVRRETLRPRINHVQLRSDRIRRRWREEAQRLKLYRFSSSGRSGQITVDCFAVVGRLNREYRTSLSNRPAAVTFAVDFVEIRKYLFPRANGSR